MPDDAMPENRTPASAEEGVCPKCLGAGGFYKAFCALCQRQVSAWYEYLPGKEGPEHWPHPIGMDCGHAATTTLGFTPCPVCLNVNKVEPDL